MSQISDTTEIVIKALKYSGSFSVFSSAVYSFLDNHSKVLVSIGAILGITLHILSLIGRYKRKREKKHGNIQQNKTYNS